LPPDHAGIPTYPHVCSRMLTYGDVWSEWGRVAGVPQRRRRCAAPVARPNSHFAHLDCVQQARKRKLCTRWCAHGARAARAPQGIATLPLLLAYLKVLAPYLC
jgi:hypothetical protein